MQGQVRVARRVVQFVAILIAMTATAVPVAAEDAEAPGFTAWILAGDCVVVQSQPVVELGALTPDHDAAWELADAAEAEPDAVFGVETDLPMTRDELEASEHIVVVRKQGDGDISPVVACAPLEHSEDADWEHLDLEPFGDTGIEGRARLVAGEQGMEVAIGIWDAPPATSKAARENLPEIPDFALTLMDGETIHLSDYRGKTVLMVMWASWCPYCDAEFPMYEEIWQASQDDDVVVLGVGLKNDDQGDAEALLEKHGVTFPVGRDTEGGSGPRGEIESTLGVPGTPALFLITPSGHVYGAQFGVVERTSMDEAIADAATYRDE